MALELPRWGRAGMHQVPCSRRHPQASTPNIPCRVDGRGVARNDPTLGLIGHQQPVLLERIAISPRPCPLDRARSSASAQRRPIRELLPTVFSRPKFKI